MCKCHFGNLDSHLVPFSMTANHTLCAHGWQAAVHFRLLWHCVPSATQGQHLRTKAVFLIFNHNTIIGLFNNNDKNRIMG